MLDLMVTKRQWQECQETTGRGLKERVTGGDLGLLKSTSPRKWLI